MLRERFIEGSVMSITVEATYENGLLNPAHPVPLQERQKVQITIETALNRVRATAGLIGWTADPEVVRRIAEDDEFSVLESP